MSDKLPKQEAKIAEENKNERKITLKNVEYSQILSGKCFR